MKIKNIFLLFALGLGVGFLASVWIQTPGYMDSSYYYTTAMSLARGEGLVEPYIWNYLGTPELIPHPSHQYWLPLATFLASIPLKIGSESFRTAQIIFIVLTGCIPVVTGLLGYRLTRSHSLSTQAGLLALIPGYYLPFFVTTDNFVVYALTGTAALWLMAEAADRSSFWLWMAAGAAAGLCYLSRADGILIIIPALFLLVSRRSIRFLPSFLAGYLLLITPWWVRNQVVFGHLMGGADSGVVWMTDYDQLFRYPAESLGFDTWIQYDMVELIRIRAEAAWMNLMSLAAVNGLIVLGPFMVIAALKLRRSTIIRAAGMYLLILFGAMSMVFPLAGPRGSFFHSASALMPLSWALVPYGFQVVIEWGTRERGWKPKRARWMFAPLLVSVAFGLTLWNYWNRVIGDEPGQLRWSASHELYAEIGDYLNTAVESPGLGAIKDPPTMYAASNLSTVVVPYGGMEALLEVCEHYGVEWVVLDKDHPEGYSILYESPDEYGWLEPVSTWKDLEGSPVYLLNVIEENMPE